MKRLVLENGAAKTPETSSSSNPSQEVPVTESNKSSVNENVQTRPAQDHSFLPPELMSIAEPSLKFGAGVGALGLFVGAASGIARSAPPLLFSLVSGGQWFALGSSYYASRQIAFHAMGGEKDLPPAGKVKASAMAGGFAGMIGGLLRGPRNVLPGMLVFSLLGAGGQAVVNTKSKESSKAPGKGFLHSKWSPVTALSDEDYEKMLQEKLLRVEADLAIVEDHIRDLHAAESAAKERQPSEQNSSVPPDRH
ncbi:hypothetical protein B0T17DRAFT_490455 [Bombardia bombarda]|uniref:Uncharacterized protein n=1 Tax=Bombardia bombarda TaxID=252184 RepID=A0AA39XAX5_9PEZI|nr:hypothetical protein B0T17DRAFT_490455 [Bombardia bombarda]